jgi:N-acetylmuramoyl-L-alanine amidase
MLSSSTSASISRRCPADRRAIGAGRRSPSGPGLALAVLAIALSTAAGAAQIERIRHFTSPDHTRLVLDLDAPARYELRRMSDPERLVIDVPDAGVATATTQAVADGLVARVRCNPGATGAQVVVDLDVAGTDHRHFVLRAEGQRPDRIVLDVLRPETTASRGPAAAPDGDWVVVIDPGHGGLDPGAERAGVQEKDVVLDVARRVRKLLDQTPGVAARLTRTGDWYPSLADRVESARKANGDLFVSIHCNTHRKRSVRGMEVYFLSLQGATDREASELADAENAADMVGLAAGDQTGDAVLSILMDLHMTRTLRRSSRLSGDILDAASAAGLPTRRVKQAGFQVLRSLAMPSALVELAYLSNPEDRRLLTSDDGRQKLAEAVVAGILRFRAGGAATPPPVLATAGPPRWTHRYEVRRGDNLYRLSRRYGTTVAEIRERNRLRSDRIHPGQNLSLPEGGPAP